MPATKLLPPVGVTDAMRFDGFVDQSGGPNACWPWLGGGVEGYGTFRLGKRKVRAHRVAWSMWSGKPDTLMDLDHVCHNPDLCRAPDPCPHRKCCNPRHLRPTTPRENVVNSYSRSRQLAERSHCPRGHDFTAKNTRMYRGSRRCRRCDAEDHAVRRIQ